LTTQLLIFMTSQLLIFLASYLLIFLASYLLIFLPSYLLDFFAPSFYNSTMRSPHRFFIPGVSSAERIEAPRDEAQHIVRVLRLKIGDTLAAFDGTGVECACRIAEQSGRRVLLDVMERRAVSRELPVRVTLAIAASKNKAMDLIVQKCTELGLARLIPFHSGRSVARVDDGDKAEKWRRVAVEAAKQCGRNVLPQIDPPLALEGMIAGAREHDVALVAAPGPQAIPLKQALHARPQARGIICIIGPEGGFPPDELDGVTAAGITAVSLGPSILRVETAAIAMLAMIVYEYSRRRGSTDDTGNRDGVMG